MNVFLQISSFLGDYSNALSRANALDAQIQSDASKISSNYAGLVALSVRQTFGAMEITVSKDASGQFDTSDIMSFLKGTFSSVCKFGSVYHISNCRDFERRGRSCGSRYVIPVLT